ncbi:hypothetical protein C8R45DRAFT_1220370 [Mycena sanguinolenta]|nr:hypothetical protein C8R45DRAFT_1220370 [Mycena sanguinolenta]
MKITSTWAARLTRAARAARGIYGRLVRWGKQQDACTGAASELLHRRLAFCGKITASGASTMRRATSTPTHSSTASRRHDVRSDIGIFQPAETDPIDHDNLPYAPTPAPTSSCTQFLGPRRYSRVEVMRTYTVAARGVRLLSTFFTYFFSPPELRPPPDLPRCEFVPKLCDCRPPCSPPSPSPLLASPALSPLPSFPASRPGLSPSLPLSVFHRKYGLAFSQSAPLAPLPTPPAPHPRWRRGRRGRGLGKSGAVSTTLRQRDLRARVRVYAHTHLQLHSATIFTDGVASPAPLEMELVQSELLRQAAPLARALATATDAKLATGTNSTNVTGSSRT